MLKSAWAYHNGQRIMTATKAAVAEIKKQERIVSLKLAQVKRAQRVKIMKEYNLRNWANLQINTTLSAFGLSNVIIAKINKKSIIDDEGVRWTQKEIFNHNV